MQNRSTLADTTSTTVIAIYLPAKMYSALADRITVPVASMYLQEGTFCTVTDIISTLVGLMCDVYTCS